MGQNSTEVAYNFGQMGSVFSNLAKPVYPPKDHVIVAIQFLQTGNEVSVLETETLDTMGPQFPSTGTTEATDNNYLGVCESAVDGAGSTAGVVTIAANAKIKKGQYIIIGADADAIGSGITLDTGAGHIDPVYQGPNAQGLIVKNIDGTTLTIANADGATFDASNLDANNTLYFLDEYHGVGGTDVGSVSFIETTIFGRWTKFVGDGKPVICYFGK
jgi:hypothetical protein